MPVEPINCINMDNSSRIISNIWKCFSEISTEKAQCCVCGVCLPRVFQNSIENTIILEEHLAKIHNTNTSRSDLDEDTKLNCQKYDFKAPKQGITSDHITTKHKSFMWNHFSKLSTDHVQCNHCGNKYVYISKNTGTGNFIKHLKKKHRELIMHGKSYQNENTKLNCKNVILWLQNNIISVNTSQLNTLDKTVLFGITFQNYPLTMYSATIAEKSMYIVR